MTEFNSCAKLVSSDAYTEALEYYVNILDTGNNPLGVMLNMQHSLQEKLYDKFPHRVKDPNNLDNLKDIYEWIRDNKIAFDDEHSELISALPGMSMPAKDRSAIWKKWKENHDTIGEMKLTDLSEDDLVELKMELLDMFFFFMNIINGINVSAEELFCLYYLKNAENFRRYNEGY